MLSVLLAILRVAILAAVVCGLGYMASDSVKAWAAAHSLSAVFGGVRP